MQENRKKTHRKTTCANERLVPIQLRACPSAIPGVRDPVPVTAILPVPKVHDEPPDPVEHGRCCQRASHETHRMMQCPWLFAFWSLLV